MKERIKKLFLEQTNRRKPSAIPLAASPHSPTSNSSLIDKYNTQLYTSSFRFKLKLRRQSITLCLESTNIMSTKNWKDLAAAKKAHQQTIIPAQWIIANPPPKDQLDASALPESYRVLSAKDVEITNAQVDVLLAKLADGTWSAVDVTTAFSKRAIIAHQLVCPTSVSQL